MAFLMLDENYVSSALYRLLAPAAWNNRLITFTWSFFFFLVAAY